MDSLKRRVLAYDRKRNTPRQMDVTTRGVELKRICFVCRQSPDAQRYRADWLIAHPLPRGCCRRRCGPRTSFNSTENHKQWHVDAHVADKMPPFATFVLSNRCQFCSGRLIEVTW